MKRAIISVMALSMAMCLIACSSSGGGESSVPAESDSSSSSSESKAVTQEAFHGLTFSVPGDWKKTDQSDDRVSWDCNAEKAAVFSIVLYTWDEAKSEPARGGAYADAYYSNKFVEDDVAKGTVSYESFEIDTLPARKAFWNKKTASMEVPVTELCVVTSKGLAIMHGEALASINDEFAPLFISIMDSVNVREEEIEAFHESVKSSSMSEAEIEALNTTAQGQIKDAIRGEKTWSAEGAATVGNAQGNAESSTNSSSNVSSTPVKSKQAFSASTYRVGQDCPAGEYKLTASGHGYFCVYPDTSKGEILENSNFNTCEYVTVSEGQCLEVKHATFVSVDDAEPTSGALTGNGRYLVGFDCPAGEYALTAAGGKGYYCINDSSQAGATIIQNNNFDGNDFCTVTEGQYLTLARCTAELS